MVAPESLIIRGTGSPQDALHRKQGLLENAEKAIAVPVSVSLISGRTGREADYLA